MKILLIEDDEHSSQLVSATLFGHHYAVDAIADGAAGLEMASQWSYDLILLDILLPKLNGIEVCRRLRDRGCHTPILMLTTQDANEDIVAGLDAGADDYLSKCCDSSQLLARVRALLRRCGNTSPSPVLTWGLLCLDPAAARVSYNHEEIALRPKEYALLELFLRNPHRILSRSTIIDHLWSMEDTPVEGSITNLIKDLRQRLKLAGMVEDLIETVYGLGYRLKAVIPAQVKVRDSIRADKAISCDLVAEPDWQEHQSSREQQGRERIRKATERFQGTLKQRLAGLELVIQSLQTGHFTLEQRQAMQTEVHKLAGGLGTFGCSKASEVAKAIEDLLEDSLHQESRLIRQLPKLLNQLKQELAEPLGGCLKS
jgi:DNA-binding response OmpR family regulator/HPt (histidine-containing phosphotransfer) domain-containing protein